MPTMIKLPRSEPFDYDLIPEQDREWVDQQLAAFAAMVEANPLQGLDPFPKQCEFMASRAKVKMAICGNRAGKTECGVAYVLIQCVDRDCLPPWLETFKFWDRPVAARVVTMDLGATLFGVMIPKVQKLVPSEQLLGGSWDKAFEKTLRILRFKNGSTIQFMSCDQDVPKFAGAVLDLVLFDEEPPAPNGYDIYRENRKRLIDRAGQMLFTMTPLMGLSWTYDELYERRHLKGIDVFQWSMLDNPHLPAEEVAAEIADIRSDKERRAIVEGEFVHFRGRVLEEFDEAIHVVPPPSRKHVKGLDVVVGIDPGIARGGVVWVGFDRDNNALVFDELYPGDMKVDEIVPLIRQKNQKWGVVPDVYVIDPTSRNRSPTDGFDVKGLYSRAGINAIDGLNDRVVGIMEMKARLENKALLVAENCEKWLFEQGRWLVAEDEASGKGDRFTTLGPDHLMDPTRYALMFRPYGNLRDRVDPVSRGHRPTYQPDFEDPWAPAQRVEQWGPMGAYS